GPCRGGSREASARVRAGVPCARLGSRPLPGIPAPARAPAARAARRRSWLWQRSKRWASKGRMWRWRPCDGHDTVLFMRTSPRLLLHRVETWLWTGPAGHLLGGVLDFVQALGRYLRMRYGPEGARPARWR